MNARTSTSRQWHGSSNGLTKATRHWDYRWYAANRDGLYVMGFTNEWECRRYCSYHEFYPMTKGDAEMSGRDPRYLENWTDDYPTDGVDGKIDI